MNANLKTAPFSLFAPVQSLCFILSTAFLLSGGSAVCQDGSRPVSPTLVSPAPASLTSDYDQLVVAAGRLLNDGNLPEAMMAARQAMAANATRYEAYALAAKIASKQGNASDAKDLIAKALALAPGEKKEKVRQLAEILVRPTTAPAEGSAENLSDEDKLKLEVMTIIMDNARKAGTPDERGRLFKDFLDRSADFVKAHPQQTNVWLFRAVAALDLNDPHAAWEAGQHLKSLGLLGSQQPQIHQIFIDLELKGWLGQEPKSPQAGDASAKRQDPVPSRGATVRSAAEYRRLLEISSDDEWGVILPLVERVLGGLAEAGGAPIPPGHEAAALRQALESKASNSELKARLGGLRNLGQTAVPFPKAAQGLADAQESLRSVLTIRQEAIAVSLGLLP